MDPWKNTMKTVLLLTNRARYGQTAPDSFRDPEPALSCRNYHISRKFAKDFGALQNKKNRLQQTVYRHIPVIGARPFPTAG